MTDIFISHMSINSDFRGNDKDFDEAEQERLETIHHEGERLLFMAAHQLLHHLLDKLDCKKPVFYESNGKLAVINNDYYISLSHAQGRIIVVATKIGLIGVDIELVTSIDHIISDVVFSEKEKNWLKELESDQDKIETFFQLWTMKEALLKATGQALLIDPTQFTINPKRCSLDGLAPDQSQACEWFLLSEKWENYAVALACKTDFNKKPNLIFIEP